MQLNNVVIKLEWPQHIDVSELRKFILSNFPKRVEIIRWYIDDMKILNTKTRTILIKISASILN